MFEQGRKRSRQRRRPDGRIKEEWITEGFVKHTRSMRISPAWEALPDNARRVLDRLEREHMDQGGSANGKLICTYSDFEKAGIRRNSSSLAIRQCEALGFLRVSVSGNRSIATERYPNRYRLTYLIGRGESTDITNEWRALTSIEDAEARLSSVAEIRNYRGQPRSRRKSPEAKTLPGPEAKTLPVQPRAGGENATRLESEPEAETLLPSISCPGGVAA